MSAELITRIYVGYFDRAPDPEGLQYWIDQLANGQSLLEIAQNFARSPEAKDLYPSLATPSLGDKAQFITDVYQNLFNRDPDPEGLAYWMANIEMTPESVGRAIIDIMSGAQGEGAAILNNKVEAGLYWATETANSTEFVYDAAAIASARSAVGSVDATQASVDASKTATDDFILFIEEPDTEPEPEGQIFVLTPDADSIPGMIGSRGVTDNDGDDLIIAGTTLSDGVLVNTLDSSDFIDGGEGFDTLRIINGADANILPTVSNVERFDIQSLPGVDLITEVSFLNVSGAEQIWNYRSANDVNVSDVQQEAVVGIQQSDADYTVGFDDSVDFGGDFAIALIDAGSDDCANMADLTINGAGVVNLDTLNIQASGENYLGLDFNEVSANKNGPIPIFSTLNIEDAPDAAGSLFLRAEDTEFDGLTEIDATGLSGALDLYLADNHQDLVFNGGDGDTTLVAGDGSTNITTGAGNDEVTTGDGASIISTGDGDNTVTTGHGDKNITTGAGNDNVTAGNGASVISTGDGDNTVTTGDGENSINTGDGTDTVTTGNGDKDINTGAGDDTVTAGDGENEINTGDGDDTVTTGHGENDINTGDGDDTVTAGNGGNDIDTGDGNDTVITGEGNDTVTTGDGDDTVTTGEGADDISLGFGDDTVHFDGNATIEDEADGGAGTDLIGIDVDDLAELTADGTFAGRIDDFEQVHAKGEVADGADLTIDLGNLDDIDHVITDGTQQQRSEVRTFQISTTGDGPDVGAFLFEAFGQSILITMPAGENTPAQMAAAIVAAFEEAEGPFSAIPEIEDIVLGNDDGEITVTVRPEEGDVADDFVSISASPFDVSFGEGEVDVAAIEQTPWQQTMTFALDNPSDGTVSVFVGGQEIDFLFFDTDDAVAVAEGFTANINAAQIDGVTAHSDGDQIIISYDADVFDEEPAGMYLNNNIFGVGAEANPAPTTQNGEPSTGEVRSYDITVTDTTLDGRIVIGGVVIEIPAGSTVGDIGLAILAKEQAIKDENAGVVDLSYDTGELIVSYAPDADELDIDTDNNWDTVAAGAGTGNDRDGIGGGRLTLQYADDGGTLELLGDNDGLTIVDIDGAEGSSDTEFTIILGGDATDNEGQVRLDSVEELNIVIQSDTGAILGLDAESVEKITVTGTGGVTLVDAAFGDDWLDDLHEEAAFANLVDFDASGLTVDEDDFGVFVWTRTEEDATLTGSAGGDILISGDGDDTLSGGDGNDILVSADLEDLSFESLLDPESGAGQDTMSGGAGDDALLGGADGDTLDGGTGRDLLWGGTGADTLTGGDDIDYFLYVEATESTGTQIDTITDFVGGEDKLVFFGTDINYLGEVDGLPAANTAFSGEDVDDVIEAVLDTSNSELYLDVNQSGELDAGDMVIKLTGVTDLSQEDFTPFDV